jgi:serine/threonine protein kinase
MRLPDGTEIENQITGDVYRLDRFLSQGGFGTAYVASKLRGERTVGDQVCLKLTTDPDAWHGEAYFGGLLRSQPNVVRQLDAFPTSIVTGGKRRTAFVIEMELVVAGTVRDACLDGRLPWPEDRVARKVRTFLKPLGILHAMGVSHRDITPGNVFVGGKSSLKLGDYGIARAGLKASGVPADLATWSFAPAGIGAYWRPADDVYQIGLLMMTLLLGSEVTNDYGAVAVNQLTSKELGLRTVIKKAIGPRSRRYATAAELAEDLPRRK